MTQRDYPLSQQATDNTRPVGWNGRFSITITLVTAIGLLTLVSVGGVLGVGVWLAQKNTFSLLSTNAHQRVSAAVDRIEQHLRPVEYQATFLAEQLSTGRVDVANRQRLTDLFTGALAAAPQIDSVIYIDNNLQAYVVSGVGRHGRVAEQTLDYSQDPEVQRRMAAAVPGPNWGEPIWRDITNRTYISLVVPIMIDGKSHGVVVASVSIRELSNFVSGADLGATGTRFILYGQGHVLAHSLLTGDYPGRNNENPVPTLAGFQDPILAAIWRQSERHDLLLKLPEGTDGHVLEIGSDTYIYF